MNPLVLKVLAGVGVVSAGVGGGWYIHTTRKEKVEDEGDEQPQKQVIVIVEGRKFSEFSGYQSDLQALMHYLKDKVNTFNELSGKYESNKENLKTEIKNFHPYIKATYEQLKACKCAAESGVKDMDAMDEFMGIVGEINEGRESSKISNFSELFKKVYEDLKRLEDLVNSSLGAQ